MSTPANPDRKVVLLTGASGQIGTAFCRQFAATYDIVAVRHRRPLEVTTQLQSYIDPFAVGTGYDGDPAGSTGQRDAGVFEITADLRAEADVARVVEVSLARFGRIDAVVNAVGAFGPKADLLGAGLAGAPGLYEINALVPTAVAVQVALDLWRHSDRENQARNRVVVNLSAAAAIDAADRTFGMTFGATKAALNMLSLHLAERLQPFKVRVVTVAPAPVPEIVAVERVTAALAAMIEGDETGRVLLLWDDGDELV